MLTPHESSIFWLALAAWSTPLEPPRIPALPTAPASAEALAAAAARMDAVLRAPEMGEGWTRTEKAAWKISQKRKAAKKGLAA